MDRKQLTPLMSSVRMDWETPLELFTAADGLCTEATGQGFDLDAAASAANAKTKKFYSEESDGLSRSWPGNVWLNPPYGRGIAAWIDRACSSIKHESAYIAVLVPSRTDTRWFCRAVERCAEIRFIVGRVRFVGAKTSAPFPSVLLIFDDRKGTDGDAVMAIWDPYGRRGTESTRKTETFIQGLESTKG